MAIFLIVFGVRASLVKAYGSPVPFWDQWDAEARHLYPSWLEGRLDWKVLFERHNEHRILITRVLSLALLSGNQLWDPILQMVVNSGLHAAFAVLLFFLLCRVVRGAEWVCLAVTLLLTAIPFEHENLLSGFQSQFDLMFIFTFLAIWMQSGARQALTARWWWGWVPLWLGLGTMAGGLFTAVALAGVLVVQAIVSPEYRHYRQWIGVGLLMAFAFLALAFHLPRGGEGEHSIAGFFRGFFTFLSWPVGGGWGWIIVYLPALVGMVQMFRRKLPLDASVRITLGLTFWVMLHAAAVAINRGEMVLASRYLSINACGIAASFLWGFHLLKTVGELRWQRPLVAGVSGWFFVTGAALILDFEGFRLNEMLWMAKVRHEHLESFDQYLAQGNDQGLVRRRDNPLPPYHDTARLKEILETQSLRKILPFQMLRGMPAQSLQNNAAFVSEGGLTSKTDKAPISPYWGTFGTAHGEAAMGEMKLQFNADSVTNWVEIWMAGAPSPKGSSLIIQDSKGGRKIRLVPAGRPGDEWQRFLVKVPYRPFQMVASDRFPDRWFAFTAPRSVGRWERQKCFLLDHGWHIAGWGVFILLGWSFLWGLRAVNPPANSLDSRSA